MILSIAAATVITCAQAMQLVNRVTSVIGLNDRQRNEISMEIKKVVPRCPVIVQERSK